MWDWILKIVDFIRALLSQKADSARKQNEEDTELEAQKEQIENKVDEKYDRQEQSIPTDGPDLVDYWAHRELHGGSPDSTSSDPKGGTKPK